MSQPGHDADSAKRMAENYERYFVPNIGAPVAAELVREAELRPGERVLDAACGTGVVAKLAAERVAPGGSVTGLDLNQAMLEVARETTPAGVAIDWHQAPAAQLPLPDESFDAVLCGMGLQFFPDGEAGLREFHRVLVAGGRLAANVPGPTPPPFRIMAEVLGRHVDPDCAKFVHAVFSLDDPGKLRDLARRAGFEDVDVRSAAISLELPPPKDFLWQYIRSTPLAAVVGGMGEESRAALGDAFSEGCREFSSKGPLEGAVTMLTLIATK